MQEKIQPRSEGLSSYHPQRARSDPGTHCSHVSQNLGDDNQIMKGMGGLVGILSIFNLQGCRMCCYQNKPGLK